MSRLGDQEYGRLNGSCYNPYGPSSENSKPMADREKLSGVAEKESSSDTSRTHSTSPPWVSGGTDHYSNDSVNMGTNINDANSSGLDGGGGDGRKETDVSESSNSSSGGVPGSGNGGMIQSDNMAGNGRSESYESDDDRGIESEEKKRAFGHRGGRNGGGGSNGSKETSAKSKMQEEDDEATDSADEGEGEEDTPNSMIMDFNPPSIPHSNHSSASEGGSISGPSRGAPSTQFPSGGGFTIGSRSSSSSSGNGGGSSNNRASLRGGPTNTSNTNHYEEGDGLEESLPLLSTPMHGKSP